jgi:aminoglycoside/choline kinase family phosphotransferase
MTDREILKQNFLQKHNFAHYRRDKMKEDASFRKYERITTDHKTYLLMDAPPDKEKVIPFIEIGNFLYNNNFSAPEIIAQDTDNGFLLLEDFGDELYTKVLSENEKDEEYFYRIAINALIQLQNTEIKDNFLPKYDDETLINEALLFTQWYLPILTGEQTKDELVEEYKEILIYLLQYTKSLGEVFVHRDYHADNLLWLEEREGTSRVGIIDFQDAVIGSPIYDMVSILSDVRRDVSQDTVDKMISHYLNAKPSISRKDFLSSYAILGAQRNLKIIGIVARKSLRDHNSSYLNLLPRAWKHVETSLKHPLLLPLQKWLNKVVTPGMINNANKTHKILA